VRQIVQPGDFLDSRFYDALHTRIYKAMLTCEGPPNQIAVAREMNRQGTLRRGDCEYLVHLVSECPCSLDYSHYAKAVADYSLQRKLGHHVRKGNYDKAQVLLKKRTKPKFTGGIIA